MEDVSKVAFALSKLTEINLKRSDRYTAAAEKVRNAYRKTMLMNYAYHAQQLGIELNRWLEAYHVNVQAHSDNIIKMSWEKVKDLFVKESETHIYEECESLEEEAVRGYNTALELPSIPPKAVREVKRHIQHIEKIRDNLKSFRSNLQQMA
jgi:uncharacterized protein (TIGR02284 family)